METNWFDVDCNESKSKLKAYDTSDSQSYDLSFAYKFKWECPKEDIHEALKILLCANTPGAAKENTSREDVLPSHELDKIQWLIAINPNTPPPVLDSLVNTGRPALLERIAEHPRVRPATLAQLANHPASEVRAAVADNLNTSWETLQRLSDDENPDVRFRLAENHRTPLEILQRLAQDENPYVAHRAHKTLGRLGSHELIQGQFCIMDKPTGVTTKGHSKIAGFQWKQAP